MTALAKIRLASRITSTAWLVAFLCAGLVLFGHFLRQLNVDINPLAWSSAQIISALLSFTIAANVLVRYHGTSNRVSLLLGLTFAVRGLIQLVAIPELYHQFLVRSEHFRVPLAWMIGQTLMGLLFLTAYALDKQVPWPRDPRKNIFAASAIVIAAACMVAVAFFVFPHDPPIRPLSFVSRPWDILPALLFLASAIVLKQMNEGEGFAFDSVLVWVAGINASSHIIATQSARLLDAPAAASQLVNTIGYVVLLGATLIDNARLFRQVRTLAISDSLTGLANYRRLVDIVQVELERSGRTNRSFSVLLMDLDGLKIINDRYGHLVGSRALCRVADILRLNCRSVDTAARYGGDEFALVLPETSEVAAQQVADRIHDRLEHDTEFPRLSLSIGIATFPQSGNSVQQLLETADGTLYAKKEQSKGRKVQKYRRK
jgi:diguanylate cyclase (GGDEF)-like protein